MHNSYNVVLSMETLSLRLHRQCNIQKIDGVMTSFLPRSWYHNGIKAMGKLHYCMFWNNAKKNKLCGEHTFVIPTCFVEQDNIKIKLT